MRTCDVDSCERVHYGLGFCNMHYRRVKVSGSPGEPFTRKNYVVDGERVCLGCAKVKPIEEFDRKKDGGIFGYCSSCKPIRIKRNNIMRKFNLTLEQWLALVEKGCAICGSKYRLAVDHDHSCCPGKKSCGRCVRGALCMRHNLILGNARDSVDELKLLIKYLEES